MAAKQRAYRYNQKIELIEERLSDVESLILDFKDKIKRLACYKAFQELSEAIFDVVAMLIKDKGKVVEDDYNNLNKLEKLGLIGINDVKILQEVNGLRNRIIHKYNKTDDEIAKESMIELLPSVKGIIKKLIKITKNG